MTHAELDLALRLDRLERENRTLKRWGIGAVALAGVAVLSSAAAVTCKTVWAERFVLKDPSMNERAVLTAYENGGLPALRFLDQNGDPALALGVDKAGLAYLEVPGDDGLVRRSFATSAEGHPTLKPEARPSCGKDDEVALVR